MSQPARKSIAAQEKKKNLNELEEVQRFLPHVACQYTTDVEVVSVLKGRDEISLQETLECHNILHLQLAKEELYKFNKNGISSKSYTQNYL